MKKILLSICLISMLAAQAQVSNLSSVSGLQSDPTVYPVQKTYTSCSYEQESNAFEDGRISNVLYPLVCADDFVVPAGECWDITEVVVNFFTNNPTDATVMELTFYANAGGMPGTIVGSFAASPANYTTAVVGSNYGYNVNAFTINLTTPVNLCGGGSGTTYWFSAQVVNTISSLDFYWEMATTIPTYGNNGMNADTEAGPWSPTGGTDNFVFELIHPVVNNLTLTECSGFSINVGTNTYNTTGVTQDILTAVNGCDSIVNLDLTILPEATGTDVLTVCDSVVWIDGLTYYADNSTATFNLVGGSVNGCDSLVTLNLTVNSVDNGVTQTGQKLITADEVGGVYQWLDCNNAFAPVATETNQSFTAGTAGSYAVAVTANGCTDTSACVVVDFSGISENASNLISFYPNPAQNIIYLQGMSALSGVSNITITSATGSVVAVYSLPVQQLDISEIAKGIYFINVFHSNGRETVRFIKE